MQGTGNPPPIKASPRGGRSNPDTLNRDTLNPDTLNRDTLNRDICTVRRGDKPRISRRRRKSGRPQEHHQARVAMVVRTRVEKPCWPCVGGPTGASFIKRVHRQGDEKMHGTPKQRVRRV